MSLPIESARTRPKLERLTPSRTHAAVNYKDKEEPEGAMNGRKRRQTANYEPNIFDFSKKFPSADAAAENKCGPQQHSESSLDDASGSSNAAKREWDSDDETSCVEYLYTKKRRYGAVTEKPVDVYELGVRHWMSSK